MVGPKDDLAPRNSHACNIQIHTENDKMVGEEGCFQRYLNKTNVQIHTENSIMVGEDASKDI